MIYIFRAPAPYQAYMLANSDPEFSVTPATGELPPVDNQGALLIVSFTPAKYGKVYRGKLVVQVRKKYFQQYNYMYVQYITEHTCQITLNGTEHHCSASP